MIFGLFLGLAIPIFHIIHHIFRLPERTRVRQRQVLIFRLDKIFRPDRILGKPKYLQFGGF